LGIAGGSPKNTNRKNSWIWIASAWFLVVRISEYYTLRTDLGHELTLEGSLRYTVVEFGFWLIMTPIMAKTDLLQEARSGRFIYERQEDTAQKVRIWGDSAVITAKLWAKGTEDGKPFDYTVKPCWMRSLLALDPTAIASKLPAGLLSPMAAVFQTAADSGGSHEFMSR
jgi:hypothetical protein